MTDLADWMELQRPKATHDFALGSARFQEMLKATEGVTISLAVLEKAGHDDLQRNLAALNPSSSLFYKKSSFSALLAIKNI